MSGRVAEATVTRIISKLALKKYKTLNIKWYGGEPLLGYRQIIEMSQKLIYRTV